MSLIININNMEFKKYNSIENSYQEKFMEKCFYSLNGYNDFIVQEKIHWANFAFYVSDWDITCAKRTSFLNEDDRFFDFQTVRDKYEYSMKALQKEIWKDIVVIWEIFWQGVQKWIHYSETKDFYAFDLKIDWEYLDTDTANKYFEKYNLLYAKTLFRWTIEECMQYPVEWVNVKTVLDWKEFKEWENIWEWVVIRPNKVFFLWNPEDSSRVIFKKKASAFSEKKAPDKISFDTSSFEEYEVYITEPRAEWIMWKYGEIESKKDLAKYTWYFMQDVIEDMKKDWIEISKQANKYLFQKSIKMIMSKYF